MKDKSEKYEKLRRFWYNVMPYVFTAGAIIFSLLYFEFVKKNENGDISSKIDKVGLTSLFDGNPNIVAILGVLCMIPCLLIIPKSILKERKNGDGLGLMFMPLGLLGIFIVMCTIENVKDEVLGITIGVALFVISALATFRKTIKYVSWLCIAMMFVAVYTLFAGYMPYCFVDTQKVLVNSNYDYVSLENYYLSYFCRDIFILMAFGTFCARISAKYKELDAAKKEEKKNASEDVKNKKNKKSKK